MSRPAWFVATLLLMLLMLMTAHLYVIRVGIRECDEYAQVLIEQAKRLAKDQAAQVKIEANNTECNNIEDDFSKLAAQYISLVLALLGGAGITASGKTP
jgi:hypothetical protein